MSIDNTEKQSRSRILSEAERLFSSHGFDGTGVEAVARAAGVNKATIYHHFRSKQEILHCLIDRFLEEFVNASMDLLEDEEVERMITELTSAWTGRRDVPLPELTKTTEVFLTRWLQHLLQFFCSRRDVLRIMMVESLKDGEHQSLLFRMSDIILSHESRLRVWHDTYSVPQPDAEMLILKFFGGLLPMAYYAVAGDTWCEHYAMQESTLLEGIQQLLLIELMGYAQTLRQLAASEEE